MRSRRQRLRMVAGRREGVALTRISVTAARGSSSDLSSALAAFAFMLSAGDISATVAPPPCEVSTSCSDSSRTCSTRIYFESSIGCTSMKSGCCDAPEHAAIAAAAAGCIRLAAQRQLRRETRQGPRRPLRARRGSAARSDNGSPNARAAAARSAAQATAHPGPIALPIIPALP